eukprot:TRINITY_DN34071_c0_g1_i1.p1 TRINITY_DN34071_c0_g1~~TRINITY_DN34071_c0_g1_i1.p1  ORF type:complete len:375 (-),score=86.20 TRINITY_DN34071_c0_g1_i1:278-1402(-)
MCIRDRPVSWTCPCNDEAHCAEHRLECSTWAMRRADLLLPIRTGSLYREESSDRLRYPGSTQFRHWLFSHVHYRPGDVVLATFPKCGPTLAEQVVLLLLNGGRPELLDPLSKNAANYRGGDAPGKVWADACIRPDEEVRAHTGGGAEEFVPRSVDWFDGLPSPRVIKTHQPAIPGCLLGGDDASHDGSNPFVLLEGVKYVVVTRNPFDCCVSFLHHAGYPVRDAWPFEAWVEAFVTAEQHSNIGSWFSWHRAWLAQAEHSEHVLWVHYEALLSSPAEEVARIAAFIGVPADPALVQRVVEGSAFDAMKAAAVQAEHKQRANTAAHLRSGKRGTWREKFSEAAEARMREAFREHFSGTEVQFDLGQGEVLDGKAV